MFIRGVRERLWPSQAATVVDLSNAKGAKLELMQHFDEDAVDEKVKI